MKGLIIYENGSLGIRKYGKPLYKEVGETLQGHTEIVRFFSFALSYAGKR